jgi:hypothetical protein
MAGTWITLTNAPPAAVVTCFLLTDGTVLAQGVSTNQWYRLTPDASGSYANGTWATMPSSVHAPLYYASGVLRDGRVIVAGGEYDAGAMVWLLGVEIYDPVANTWTTLPVPANWVRIGDAPGCVLPDGRFFLGQVATFNTAIYDPVTNSWTAAANKINPIGEESWSLLPDGSILAVDCSNPPNAEKYIVASDQWVAAGATPQVLVDSISEIGVSALLPDGRVFVVGATGFTALYTPPPIASQVGTWVPGPTIPQVNPGQPLGAVDAPAVVLPNGNVLFTAGPITVPATFQSPTFFFEYDPVANTINPVPAAATSAGVPYFGRMLMLPNGQAMYTAGSTIVALYTPSGAPDPVWTPTLTACPVSVRRGRTYTLSGRQINGLTQCVYYGNDATQATNYPIVRLESGSNVYYCRTSAFSTMGLQTGTIIHSCAFTVPASVPVGTYCLRVVANGIPSACRRVGVTNKWFKEIKYEIKEKLEILENLKEIRDINTKRLPDIDDIKLIREDINFGILEKIQEDWVTTVRTLAQNVDQANEELSRTFIRPDERPIVGAPPPIIEDLKVPRISAAEARRGQEKRAFNDGREELPVSREAEELHTLIHSLSRSGGKVTFAGAGTRASYRSTKATKGKRATAKAKRRRTKR